MSTNVKLRKNMSKNQRVEKAERSQKTEKIQKNEIPETGQKPQHDSGAAIIDELRKVWSHVLKLPTDEVDLDSSFLHLVGLPSLDQHLMRDILIHSHAGR